MKKIIAVCLILISIPLFSQTEKEAKELEKNKEYYQAALKYYEMKDYKNAIRLLEITEDFNNIAIVYEAMKNYEKSLENYIKAARISYARNNNIYNKIVLMKIRIDLNKAGFIPVEMSNGNQSSTTSGGICFIKKDKEKNTYLLKTVLPGFKEWNTDINDDINDLDNVLNKKYPYDLSKIEFDCELNLYKEISFASYNEKDVLVSSETLSQEWVEPKEGTLGSDWLYFVCQLMNKK